MATLMAKTSPASLNSPRYWLVMDFEATCEDGDRRWPNEIIEWPCVLVDAETKATVDEFRSFVRPTERPSLTPFCTRLTSITQADVADAPPLPEVLAAFDAWLRSYGASEDDGTALSVWCGDWDLATCLPRECARKGLDGAVPPVLRRWCNIKLPFVEVAAGSEGTGSRWHLMCVRAAHWRRSADEVADRVAFERLELISNGLPSRAGC